MRHENPIPRTLTNVRAVLFFTLISCGGLVEDAPAPTKMDAGCATCVRVIASGINAGSIAVGKTDLYFTNMGTSGSGTVERVPKEGGARTIVSPHELLPMGITVDDTHVYWAARGNNGGIIQRAPLAGGSPSLVADAPFDLIPGLVTDRARVYWTSNQAMADVCSAPLGGGMVTTHAPLERSPQGLAIDATHVYWANGQEGTISRARIAGGSIETIASNQSNPNKVATDGTDVYWTNAGTPANDYTDGSVMKMPVAGGAPIALAKNLTWPVSLKLDGTVLYWASIGTEKQKHADGAIVKMSAKGGEPIVLASSQSFARGITVDEGFVYWIVDAASKGKIVRVAK